MKKLLSLMLALCMLLSVCAMPAMAEEAVAMSQMQTKDIITITVDGSYVDCSAYGQLPVIVEGRTLVPLRSVFEALGATVEWNNDTRSVTSVKGEVTITLAVDSKEMVVNGTIKTLDVPAQIMNDRTMVPVRAVAEAFGCKVEWNNDIRCVVITTAAVEVPEGDIPVVDIEDTTEMTPTEVVKAAYEAMFALDFEACGKYYVNPELAMGDFAGAANVSDMVGMIAGGEDLTEAQIMLVEKFAKDIIGLITYEITGSTVNGDTAEVYVTAYAPNFESIDFEAYTSEDVMMLLMEELLAERGYSLEDVATITDEAVIEELTNALVEGVFDYIVEVIKIEAESAGYTVVEEVETLTKVDGKWLIGE